MRLQEYKSRAPHSLPVMASSPSEASYKDRFLIGAYVTISICLLVALSASVSLFNSASQFHSEVEEDMRKFEIDTNDLWREMRRNHVRDSTYFLFGRAKRDESYSEAGSSSTTTSSSGCRCAAASAHCPSGPPGPPGRDGLPGFDGVPGLDGGNGPSGHHVNLGEQKVCIKCPAGSPGSPGQMGPPGPTGSAGAPGRPGNAAAPSPPGPAGPPGPQGAPGRPGSQGSPGVAGQSGRRMVNLPGLPGPQGARGPAGAPGLDAAFTPPPRDGPQGPPGTPGKSGSPGVSGAPGPSGVAGVPGVDAAYCPCPKRASSVSQPSAVPPEPQMNIDEEVHSFVAGELKTSTPRVGPTEAEKAALKERVRTMKFDQEHLRTN